MTDSSLYWVGTAHFVSFDAARRYYRPYGYSAIEVRHKLEAGEIAIGEPRKPDGSRYESCKLDLDGRYWIGFRGE